MKKIVAIVLSLVFLASFASCFAEEEPFYAGTYYVGRDFRPGNYNIRVNKTSKDEPSCFIDIFTDEASFSKNDAMTIDAFSEEGYHLSVKDGMVFHIVVFNCTLSIVNETPSWMIANN